MAANEYAAFAAFYDRLTGDVDYAGLAAYLREVFLRHQGAVPRTLLDLACGSGSLSLELAADAEVIGVDGSEDMLALAGEKAARAGRSLLFFSGRICAASTCTGRSKGRSACSTASIICSAPPISGGPAPSAPVFGAGGLFVFDVNTPTKHRVVLGDNAFVLEDEDVVCVWRNRYIPPHLRSGDDAGFFVPAGEGRYDRLTDEVRERAYAGTTMRRLLEEEGFETLAVYGDRSFLTPGPEAERLVFVVRNTRTLEEARRGTGTK